MGGTRYLVYDDEEGSGVLRENSSSSEYEEDVWT
jgi:hypothetical protein